MVGNYLIELLNVLREKGREDYRKIIGRKGYDRESGGENEMIALDKEQPMVFNKSFQCFRFCRYLFS